MIGQLLRDIFWLFFICALTGVIFAIIGLVVVTIAQHTGFDYASYDNVPYCFGLGFLYGLVKAGIDKMKGK